MRRPRFRPSLTRLRRIRRERGAALIIALALCILLVALTAATQLQVVVQLKGEKGQRDWDRALEMAEAGANAYINYLSTSNSTNETPWGSAAPPTISSIQTTAQIRSDILAGNIKRWDGTTAAKTNIVNGTTYSNSMGLVIYPAQSAIATKPSTNNQTGYFVTLTSISATSFNMVAYGYANGVVRRVQVGGGALNVFDWAALWGMDTTSGESSWNIGGSFQVIGAFGGEGEMDFGNNSNFYYGDSVRSGSLANFYLSNTLNNSPTLLAPANPYTSAPNLSTYDPPYTAGSNKSFTRRLYIPTADAAANQVSGTTQGVEYFRTHNNNLTGIRYLVQNTTTSKIYELTSTGYTVTGTNQTKSESQATDSYQLVSTGGNNAWSPSNSVLTGAGMPSSGYTFYGVRVYPGDYFFEVVDTKTGGAPVLEMRSFNDWDRTNTTMTGSAGAGSPAVYRWPRTPIVYDMATKVANGTDVETTDPNYASYGLSGTHTDDGTSAGPRDIRFWIGHASNSNSSTDHDSQSQFGSGTSMEWPQYPSRFRAYISSNSASNSPINVSGNSSSSGAFNTNILVYNTKDGNNKNLSGGTNYGSIKFTSSTWLRGSLIAWQIASSNGGTVQKIAPEGGGSGGNGTGNSNRLVYYATGWKELP